MILDNFKKLINELQFISNRLTELYRLDIDLINYSEKYDKIIWTLMSEVFNKKQIEIIEWWLYEDVKKYIYDSTTNKILYDLTEIEDLYNYIKKYIIINEIY